MTLEAKKFIFEKSFDIELEPEINEEDFLPVEPPKLYTEEQYQDALTQAKIEAIEVAKREMTQAVETQMNQTIEQFLTHIHELCEACHQEYQAHFAHNTALTLAILKKVFPIFFAQHNLPEIESIIKEHMTQLKAANEIKIHLAENTPPALKERISLLFKAQNKEDILNFIEEPNYAPDQISIQWGESGIERNSETILEEIIHHYQPKP